MGLIPEYVFEVALVIGAGLLAASQLVTKDLNAAVTIAVFLAAGSRVVPSMIRLQGATMSVRTAAGQAEPTFALAAELASVEANSVAAETFGSVDSQIIRERLERGHPDFDSIISVNGTWLTYPDTSAPALAEVSFVLPAGS